jgi:formylglycine-generating enzyme required for sulfatase activity
MRKNPSEFAGERNPVEQVSWEDCQEFVKKLNEEVRSARFSVSSEERAEARTTSLRFALPTEAQWEYACRAGSANRSSFGKDDRNLGAHAWYTGNSGSKTHPVGEKKPNAWGLYDMHGNVSGVWRICWTSHAWDIVSPAWT